MTSPTTTNQITVGQRIRWASRNGHIYGNVTAVYDTGWVDFSTPNGTVYPAAIKDLTPVDDQGNELVDH